MQARVSIEVYVPCLPESVNFVTVFSQQLLGPLPPRDMTTGVSPIDFLRQGDKRRFEGLVGQSSHPGQVTLSQQIASRLQQPFAAAQV